jgi:16S rRNA G966 N2-methylase RsmD
MPKRSPSSWALDLGQEAHNWCGWGYRARERIARDVPRIAHWQIIEGDYTDAPDVEAAWFIDPPYQTKAGRHYKEQPDDFAALGEWTQQRKGQVIACDQQGASWLPWSSAISLKANAATGTSEEVIYHRSWQPSLFGDA